MQQKKNPIEELNNLPGTIPMMGAAPTATTSDIDPMARPLWEIDEIFLNPFAPIDEVQTWATMGSRPAFPCQGIVTLSAKPKQGKSLSVYAAIIPMLTGEAFGAITPTERKPRLIVVFDTEMDKPTLSKRAARMYAKLGDAAKRFMICPLLHIPKGKRKDVIADVITKYAPDVIAFDQVARLVNDFNNSTECVDFGEWAAQIAESRTAFVVIHQNKAADNTQMKGHLGSIMEELAVENYGVAKKDGVYTLTPLNARNSNVDNATPFTFALNDEGDIITADVVIERNKEAEAEKWRKDLRLIFGEDEELKASEIVTRIMAQQGLTQRPAETKLTNARNAGAIEHTDPTNNRSPYRLTASAFSDFENIEEDDL